jgi:hypothetical protein
MTATTERVFMGASPATSLHVRSTAEDTAETTVIYATSSTPEMHAVESKTGAKIRSVKSKNNVRKGSMITTVLTMTNLTWSSHRKRDTSQEAQNSLDLKRVRWPVNFKPSGIKKYDGSTNPAEWLKVY